MFTALQGGDAKHTTLQGQGLSDIVSVPRTAVIKQLTDVVVDITNLLSMFACLSPHPCL